VRANFLSDALSHTARHIHPTSLERLDLLGPTIQFVTDPGEEDAPCIMRGTVPSGVSIPLHSHADPETFLPLWGQLQGLTFRDEECEWIEIRPGAIFHVPGGSEACLSERRHGRGRDDYCQHDNDRSVLPVSSECLSRLDHHPRVLRLPTGCSASSRRLLRTATGTRVPKRMRGWASLCRSDLHGV
jgi:hypothetical protein